MGRKDPRKVAEKWSRAMAGSVEAIKAGVESVTQAPGEKAAQRADAYLAGVQTAVADGRYQEGVRSVTLEEWKRDMLGKGVQRIASGATAAVPKMQDFMAEFLPYLESGQRTLESMPRGDLQTNIQRMVAMVEHNARFRRRTRV